MTPRRASIVLLLAIIFGLTLPAQGRAQSGDNATDEAYNEARISSTPGGTARRSRILMRRSGSTRGYASLPQPGYCV